MGKKYIIELPENTHWIQWIMKGTKDGHPYMDYRQVEDLTPYTEPDTDACIDYLHKQGWLQDHDKQITESEYKRGYKDGTEAVVMPDDKIHEAYQQGMDAAWEAARKITGDDISTDDITGIFGTDPYAPITSIFTRFTASEAVDKIRQYEQEKKQEIKVGDEIVINDGTKGVVLDNDNNILYVFTENGISSTLEKDDIKKTGRYFPEIVEVLRKMEKEE